MSIIGKEVKYSLNITDSLRGMVLDKCRGMNGDIYLVQNLTTGICHSVPPGDIESVQDIPQAPSAYPAS